MKTYTIATRNIYIKDDTYVIAPIEANNMAEAMHMINMINTVNRQFGSLVRVKFYKGGVFDG